jgi:hypothetical protein
VEGNRDPEAHRPSAQPVTAVLQPVRVRSRRPPRVLCSDTRLAGRVTFLRESSGRKSSAAGERCLSRSDRSRRASNHAGHSVANTDSVERWAPTEADVGTLEEPTHCFVEEGDGSRDSSGIWTCFSSRRRGDGTRGRSADPKQGRSRRQPRPGRRAEASCITNVLGKSGGAGETDGSGRSSEDERDTITLSEQRARGSRWSPQWPEAGLDENASRTRRRVHRRRRPCQTKGPPRACGPGALSRGLCGKGAVDLLASA